MKRNADIGLFTEPSSVETLLYLENVSKFYRNGDNRKVIAVDRLNLTIQPGEFVCIIGRSGCGKTTTLRMIAGLEAVCAGNIYLNGKKITGPGAERCVVFQKYTLLPWRTILNNIAFGLEIKKVKKKERHAIARKFLDLVGLSGYADAFPYELSGGMQQRVAVARALAANPNVLLMDEPFGALDAQTRNSLQNELIKIWQKQRKTVLFVTHSIGEAVYLADRIILMDAKSGGVHQIFDNPLPRPRDRNSMHARSFCQQVHQTLEAI
jgi:NitT/TauT family transport system ATP-binding protein